MYDNIFSVIMIKEKQIRFKNETALANLFRTGDLSILVSQITGVEDGDHTDLQYCLKSDILTCLPSVSRWSRRTKHEMTNQVL